MALNSKSKSKDHDISRAERKAKKRKAEDAVPDLPGGDGPGEEDAIEPVPVVAKRQKLRDEGEEAELKKKSKKAKKKEADVPAMDEEGESLDVEETPRKTKKERKAERKAAEAAAMSSSAEVVAQLSSKKANKRQDAESEQARDVADGEGEAAETEGKKRKNNRNREKRRNALATGTEANNEAGAEAEEKKTAPRFIVFVGNLPYTTTTPSLTAHFASLNPLAVRHLTQKSDPAKSQGFAFVEFPAYDSMKTALQKYHHSDFEGRKINVELTAGGGGSTKHRKAKIGEKNFKLREERTRRVKAEEKEKEGKRVGGVEAEDGGESAVHPSRRGRVPWEMKEGKRGVKA